MPSVALVESTLTLCSQRLRFAGQSILLNTNSAAIARHACSFLPGDDGVESSSAGARATITVHVRDSNQPCESAPWFRARGNFALARFTRSDSFWFNLRTREIYGVCTPELADDSRSWFVHIFPTLLGILAASMGVAPLHAACLVRYGRGVLLTGHSGAGKSTLAIALAKRGYAFLSDEWTYLSAGHEEVDQQEVAAWGLPVPLKLLPDSRRFFPELSASAPHPCLNGEVAYEVWPNECFGVSRQTRTSVSAIVLLERTANTGCQFARISTAEALDFLSAAIEPLEGPLAAGYQRQLELIQRLAGTSCLRMSFNDDPDRIAKQLDAALSG